MSIGSGCSNGGPPSVVTLVVPGGILWNLVEYCGACWNIVEPGGIQDVEVGLFSSDDIVHLCLSGTWVCSPI